MGLGACGPLCLWASVPVGFCACGPLCLWASVPEDSVPPGMAETPAADGAPRPRPPAEGAARPPPPTVGEAPKRILFLPAAMKGHAAPMMRLAEWFAGRPGYEAHVWLGPCWRSLAPAGAVVHEGCGMEDLEEWAAFNEEVFGGLTLAKDWYSSLVALVASVGSETAGRVIGAQLLGACRLVKEVSPHLVVADGAYQTDGAIPGLCARHCGAPFVALQCPGRPEAWESLGVVLALCFRHLGELNGIRKNVLPVLEAVHWQLVEETGPPLPKPHTWPVLLPGLLSIAGAQPKACQHYVGPFLPVPEPRDPSGRRQRRRPSLADAPRTELLEWLLDAAPGEPVVYVALGTLVRVNEDIARRLVEGLEEGPWRVLWSLPEAQHAALPERARASTARWRLESFVPQTLVLGYEGVRCFVSHCGQSSMHEALAVGVPMVCVPFYCDQYEWAASVCARGAGVLLDKLGSSPEEVKAAVASVLAEKQYREGALACADELLEASREASREAVSGAAATGGNTYAGVPAAAGIVEDVLMGGETCGGKKRSRCTSGKTGEDPFRGFTFDFAPACWALSSFY